MPTFMYIHFKISLELKMLEVNCERPNHFFFYHFFTQVRKIPLYCKRSSYLATNSLLRAWFNFISSVKGFLNLLGRINGGLSWVSLYMHFSWLCLSSQSYLFAQLFVYDFQTKSAYEWVPQLIHLDPQHPAHNQSHTRSPADVG